MVMLMVIREFDIAFEKAALINKGLTARVQGECFVSLDDIVAAVKQVSHFSRISVNRQPFSKLELPDKFKKSGAMLSTMTSVNEATQEEEKVAHIIINSDYNASMQRFSVAHELGHLITEIPNFRYEEIDDGKFTISTHINPDITYIPEELCKKNKYLVAEQVANIFALLVLIPDNIRIRDIKSKGIDQLVEKYGVTEDAIYSRMLLSSVKVPKTESA